LEALSAIVGVKVRSKKDASKELLTSYRPNQPHPDVLSITDLLSAAWFEDEYWQDVQERRTGTRTRPGARNDLFVMDDDFFEPRFDCDFTHMTDTATYTRGGEVYKRPYGWRRFALKILNKYPDGNAWLGPAGHRTTSDPNEWPVSYHGTSKPGAEGIIGGNYMAGSGAAYGRGIYSTPDIVIAETHGYAKTFTASNGKKYKVCLQNRINPSVRKITAYPDYWLVPVPAGTPPDQERKIVMGAIRPYSLLLKEA
ncbi:uncharacterized protein LOC134459527, partial [Engraulis encrasicolus]|uniref:uncharacterized protein LOC134459527 n=1 Tax=Engraulis encrasicolus TaxID=184585 RepID=UPI002FCFC4D7